MSKVEQLNRDEKTEYARYEDVDKEQLEKDIDAIKETMEPVGEEDFQHLLKMERWGRIATFSGYGLILILAIIEAISGVGSLLFWTVGIVAAILISTGNVARWANVTHPILHGAYDKVPNIQIFQSATLENTLQRALDAL